MPSAANHEAAEQWAARGRDAARGDAPNYERAKACFEKSLNLYDDAEVRHLLGQVLQFQQQQWQSEAGGNEPAERTELSRGRSGERAGHTTAHTTAGDRPSRSATPSANRNGTPRGASTGPRQNGDGPHHHAHTPAAAAASAYADMSSPSPAATEANREAAEEWAKRGVALFRAGSRADALKAFDKSLRLFADPRVAQLRSQALAPAAATDSGGSPEDASDSPSAGRPQQAHSASASAPSHSRDGLRARNAASAAAAARAAASRAPAPVPKGTPEQEALVARIMSVTSYYEVLSVERTATDEDLKRAYRKLAIQCHPDKNPVGNAAFQRVGAAYGTLSDSEKRAHYDRYGEEGLNNASGTAATARANHARYEQGMDPEDIFNAFFGGGGFPPGMMGGGARIFQNGRFYTVGGAGFRQRGVPQQHAHRGEDGEPAAQPHPLQQYMQLLPLLLLLLFSFSSLIGGSREQFFALKPSGLFRVPRTTQTGDVQSGLPYYVRDDFLAKTIRDRYLLSRVERSVHEDLWNSLAGECTTERHHRQQLNTQLSYARTAKRKAQLQAEIAALSDESCTQFEKYFSSNTKGR